MRECRPHPPHNLHIRRPGPIAGRNSVHDTQYVPLHHADEIEVVFALGHVAKVFDEVHYVGAIIHGILAARQSALQTLGDEEQKARPTYSFELLQDA